MSLILELKKPKYAGFTDTQALVAVRAVAVIEGALIPATTVNQAFAKFGLSGAIKDVADTDGHPFRDAMLSVMWSIGGNHPFNFTEGQVAGDGNLMMLDQMITGMPDIAAKLTDFRTTVRNLANKPSYPYATVTIDEVIAARSAQLDDQWHELSETSAQWLNLQLNAAAPEVTHITIQWQGADGNWYHATALHGIYAPVLYKAQLPFYGAARKLRWRCEYALNGTVSAV